MLMLFAAAAAVEDFFLLQMKTPVVIIFEQFAGIPWINVYSNLFCSRGLINLVLTLESLYDLSDAWIALYGTAESVKIDSGQ